MKKGEVYLVDLNPAVGTEMKDKHYCIVVQSDLLNHPNNPKTVVVPLTSEKPKKVYPFVVKIIPPEGGLRLESFAICNQVTRIDKQRIIKKQGDAVSKETLLKLDNALRIVLDL